MDYNVKSSQVEEAHERIKASYAGIISRKITVPPYEGRTHFEIMYFDDNEKDWHIGYGSFVLEYVQTWLDEEFEPTYKRLDEAITELLARAEAAEAMVSDLEKLLSAVQNMEKFHPDETGFFVFTKKDADNITGKLLAAEARVRELETTCRIEKCENGPECVELGKARKALADAEDRAEKAERERDAAVSDMEALMWHSGDGCNICANAIEVHREPYVRLDCALKNKECTPKWRGQKEE